MKLFILVPWGERLGGAESMLWNALRAIDRDRVEPIVAFMQPGRFERDTAAMGAHPPDRGESPAAAGGNDASDPPARFHPRARPA